METKYWRDDNTFKILCDAVVENKLICLTGSGISKNLHLKESASCAPDWKELLQRIYVEVESKLSDIEKTDVLALLSDDAIGEQLIEASSILYNADNELFANTLVKSAQLQDDETSETHKALLNLLPLGIITYNYDIAHENAINQKKLDWEILLPNDNVKMISLIKEQLRTPFLLKAHGTVTDKKTMILTRESYRDLFNTNPAYKAFVQYMFTNYQFLIVGFGLSDPDFDILLQNIFSVYGSAIQKHVVIKHENQRNSKDTLYKLRYGLNFLYIKNFDDIPKIINDCENANGDILPKLLAECLSEDLETRINAHRKVNKLSMIGKKCFSNMLRKKIEINLENEKNDDYTSNTDNSELVYTLGILANENTENLILLKRIIEESEYSEPVAHALVQIKNVLTYEDIGLVEKWITRFDGIKIFREDIENPDPDNRILIYCQYLKALLRAKYKIFITESNV